MKILIIALILFVAVAIIIGILQHKFFIRGRMPVSDIDGIKFNPKAIDVRIIKVTLSGGELVDNPKDVVFYEIWERKLFLFSVRYDMRNYYNIEDAKREANRLKNYTEIKTNQEEITC